MVFVRAVPPPPKSGNSSHSLLGKVPAIEAAHGPVFEPAVAVATLVQIRKLWRNSEFRLRILDHENHLAAHHGQQDPLSPDLLRGDLEVVLLQDDEIGQFADLQGANGRIGA